MKKRNYHVGIGLIAFNFQMKEFFAKYPEAGAGSAARKRALERVENNISWRKRNMARLLEWFGSHTEQ